ncbi:MAG: hypothetical protein SFZ03_05930 [Candidatus Melainabacteria bacterium]|nr:hypothetical protein [Candidatus Melainabacteria bacterium]
MPPIASQLNPVLFPMPNQVGFNLNPRQPDQLLQGFLNIQGALGKNNGQLSYQDLNQYAQFRFFAPDPNSQVAGYLFGGFNQIAPLDGNPNSISARDLVQLRPGLPTHVGNPPPAPTPVPPPYRPPVYGPPWGNASQNPSQNLWQNPWRSPWQAGNMAGQVSGAVVGWLMQWMMGGGQQQPTPPQANFYNNNPFNTLAGFSG